ncbi:hypothetical protein HPB50_026838 [Hyalomma asiaticum]|uniref:Uncharacterized protein n=1 Tax=Hyalomma asiaticum TaxID=266040 RepID=A0ACB7S335_HYAAI|nr:hypothetical protein HPB50_026838 [Hyalomma asiaticum]
MSTQSRDVSDEMHEMNDKKRAEANTRKKPNMMMVRGTPFAGYFDRQYVESAMDYTHRSGDLFIVTYVKCGTTWMQHIVYLIQNDGVPPANAVEFYKASPFIEVCGADCMQWVKRPGAVKTHLPLHQLRYSPDAKYIVVIRNPFDVLVSMHHFWFMISAYEYDGNFDRLLRELHGQLHRQRRLLRLLQGLVARFLGPEYEQRLLADNGKVLGEVVKYSSVEEMKKYTNNMIHEFYAADFAFQGEEYAGLRKLHEVVHNARGREEGSADSADKIYYVRKGIVGDWKNYFSAEQAKRLKERFRKETRGSGIANLWPDMGLYE